MRLLSRVSVSILLVVVAFGLFASPALANTYVGPCTYVNNYRGYAYHAFTKNIKNMSARVTYMRWPIGTCTGTFHGGAPESLVMAVNMQDPEFVQLGYGIVNGGSPDFFYTDVDWSGGVLVPEPDNPVTHTHARPQSGHNYTFRIISVPQGGGNTTSAWEYQVVDNSAGTTATWYGSATGFSPYARTSWSGFEVMYDGDEFGGFGAAADIDISSIYMHYTDDSISYMNTTTPGGCCGSAFKETWWHVSLASDSSGHTVVSGYSDAHWP